MLHMMKVVSCNIKHIHSYKMQRDGSLWNVWDDAGDQPYYIGVHDYYGAFTGLLLLHIIVQPGRLYVRYTTEVWI